MGSQLIYLVFKSRELQSSLEFQCCKCPDVDPGYLDVELLFIPDVLGASDTAGLQEEATDTGLNYGLQTIVNIEYNIGALNEELMRHLPLV